MSDASILNVSFYKFVELTDLPTLQKRLKEGAIAAGLRGSILLSREGINGFLAGVPSQLQGFLSELRKAREFADIVTKDSYSSHIPFRRMLVKVKKEIITMGRPDLTPSRFTGKRLEPIELKKWIDEKKDLVLLDTRNTYEIEQGTFRGAVDFGIETFKEFPNQLKDHADELKNKTVVMFCTGGIRCEKATALAMEYGIQDVYQLEGGILKYFEDTGGAHYRGDCFVFDGREAVDPNLSGAVDRKFKEKVGSIVLHSYGDCPYSMRVRIVLEEKRLPYRLIDEDPETSAATLPILEQNRLVLRESSVITQYLSEEFPHEPELIPQKPERRARMRLWTAWVDTTLAPDLFAWRFERSNLSPTEREALVQRIQGHLFYLQNSLVRRPYMISKKFTLADAHTFPFVHFLFTDSEKLPGVERFEKLKVWHETLLQRPAVKKAIGSGAHQVKTAS